MKTEPTKLNVYDRQLIAAMQRLYPDEACVESLVERLIRIGVVDTVRCKVLVIRQYVEERVRSGARKDRFCCSYEYVRKCMYYYKEINLV